MKKYNEYINEAKNKNVHPMLLSAKRGANTVIKQFIKSVDIDINITDNDGRTSLMLATLGSFLMVVKTLLDADADVNIRDNDGRNVLCMVPTNKIHNMLLEAKANVNSKDNDGLTPIMELVYHKKHQPEILLSFLKKHIEHKLDLGIKSNKGLNFYDQLRKWIPEYNVVQQYMDENYPEYKDEFDMKNAADKYNL